MTTTRRIRRLFGVLAAAACTLLALAAASPALVAAAVAVLLDRARIARRSASATTA